MIIGLALRTFVPTLYWLLFFSGFHSHRLFHLASICFDNELHNQFRGAPVIPTSV